MRFEITKEIISAISSKLSIGGRGAMADACRKYGIRQQALSRVVCGGSPAVQEDLWLRLCMAFPEIKPMAVPKRQLGVDTSPLVVGDGSAAAVGPNASAVVGAPIPQPQDCSEAVDRYRLRVQGRLFSMRRDPVPLFDVVKVMEEESRK